MGYLDNIRKKVTPQFTFIPTLEGSDENIIHIYTDGSYDTTTKMAGFGVVIVDPKVGVIHTQNGHVDDSPYGSRNITGEIMGAVAGLYWATRKLIPHVVLVHDYVGLGEWAAGNWKTKAPISKIYKEKLSKVKCTVEFRHVKGHSGNIYNEMVDKEAALGKLGRKYTI